MAEALIVKSVRLAPAEAAAVAELAGRLHTTEAALLRRFAVEGARQALLDEGILAYVHGRATLSQAAGVAQLPEVEFGEQLRLRGIFGPGAPSTDADPRDDAERFWSSLRHVGEALGDERLLAVVAEREDERKRGHPVRT